VEEPDRGLAVTRAEQVERARAAKDELGQKLGRRMQEDLARRSGRQPVAEPFPTVPPPPAYNTYAALDERLRQGRELAGPDLRSPDRAACDRMWQGLAADCEQKFGKAPSIESWEQPSDLCVAALNSARSRESAFLQLSAAGAPRQTVDAAFEELTKAVAVWVNEATRGWPSAAERRRQALRDQEWR
jgi:hypothetical protein